MANCLIMDNLDIAVKPFILSITQAANMYLSSHRFAQIGWFWAANSLFGFLLAGERRRLLMWISIFFISCLDCLLRVPLLVPVLVFRPQASWDKLINLLTLFLVYSVCFGCCCFHVPSFITDSYSQPLETSSSAEQNASVVSYPRFYSINWGWAGDYPLQYIKALNF